jgi:hypothetical protein
VVNSAHVETEAPDAEQVAHRSQGAASVGLAARVRDSNPAAVLALQSIAGNRATRILCQKLARAGASQTSAGARTGHPTDGGADRRPTATDQQSSAFSQRLHEAAVARRLARQSVAPECPPAPAMSEAERADHMTALSGPQARAQSAQATPGTPTPGTMLWRWRVRDGGHLQVTDHVPRGVDRALGIRYEHTNPALVANVHFLQFFWFQIRLHADNGSYALNGLLPTAGMGSIPLTVDPNAPLWELDAPGWLPFYDDAADHVRQPLALTMFDAPNSGRLAGTVANLLRRQENAGSLRQAGRIRSVEFLMHLQTYLLRVQPRSVTVLARLRWVASTSAPAWQGDPELMTAPAYWVGDPPADVDRVAYAPWQALRPRFRDFADRTPHEPSPSYAPAPSATSPHPRLVPSP